VTVPRQVAPGRTYLISRRNTQRLYLLRPSRRTEQIVLYCAGEAAARFGITLHAWIVLSNHWHLLVRDNHGNLSEFLAHLHKLIAKAMNAELGRWENFWAAEQCSAVYLVEASDRFDKLVYLLANPVTDHLVERVAEWPGACSLPQHLSGLPKKVKRPHGYFRDGGPMPEEVTLVAEKPEGFEHLSDEEWAGKIRDAVRAEEQKACAARARHGWRVLGSKRIRAAATTDRPTTIEPRRTLRPHLACRRKERRVRELAALRGFRADYREARLRFEAGDHEVVFPYGTCRYARLGARCATVPPA
jgi:REP-associated tyrosine transposase